MLCICNLPYSPWLASPLRNPTAPLPMTFAEIVEEELQQEAALIRSREKPLALIQVKSNKSQNYALYESLFLAFFSSLPSFGVPRSLSGVSKNAM